MSDFVSILAMIILAVTVFTVVLAIAAYFIYKLRMQRGPSEGAHASEGRTADGKIDPIFLDRYRPGA